MIATLAHGNPSTGKAALPPHSGRRAVPSDHGYLSLVSADCGYIGRRQKLDITAVNTRFMLIGSIES
jgi:hypothetical protein